MLDSSIKTSCRAFWQSPSSSVQCRHVPRSYSGRCAGTAAIDTGSTTPVAVGAAVEAGAVVAVPPAAVGAAVPVADGTVLVGWTRVGVDGEKRSPPMSQPESSNMTNAPISRDKPARPIEDLPALVKLRNSGCVEVLLSLGGLDSGASDFNPIPTDLGDLACVPISPTSFKCSPNFRAFSQFSNRARSHPNAVRAVLSQLERIAADAGEQPVTPAFAGIH